MLAATRARGPATTRAASRRTTTLLDLVSELADAGGSDREIVTTVVHLIASGRVRLAGRVLRPDLAPHG